MEIIMFLSVSWLVNAPPRCRRLVSSLLSSSWPVQILSVIYISLLPDDWSSLMWHE